MRNLKRSSLYRVGSAFMAAAVMFTCMPQGQMYVSAQESGMLMDTEETPETGQPHCYREF